MLIWFCGGAWTARGVGCCMHAFFNHLVEFAFLVRFVITLRLLIAVQLYEILCWCPLDDYHRWIDEYQNNLTRCGDARQQDERKALEPSHLDFVSFVQAIAQDVWDYLAICQLRCFRLCFGNIRVSDSESMSRRVNHVKHSPLSVSVSDTKAMASMT